MLCVCMCPTIMVVEGEGSRVLACRALIVLSRGSIDGCMDVLLYMTHYMTDLFP